MLSKEIREQIEKEAHDYGVDAAWYTEAMEDDLDEDIEGFQRGVTSAWDMTPWQCMNPEGKDYIPEDDWDEAIAVFRQAWAKGYADGVKKNVAGIEE
jgi:hypothetical protein